MDTRRQLGHFLSNSGVIFYHGCCFVSVTLTDMFPMFDAPKVFFFYQLKGVHVGQTPQFVASDE